MLPLDCVSFELVLLLPDNVVVLLLLDGVSFDPVLLLTDGVSFEIVLRIDGLCDGEEESASPWSIAVLLLPDGVSFEIVLRIDGLCEGEE